MQMFKIERGASVSAPPKRRASIKWPWRDMQVGDLVKIDDPKLRPRAQVCCHVYGRGAGMKFRTETIDGVLHVWRVS